MPADVTTERLLDAAIAVFAEKGFAQATLAEITERAGTNIASVNYHFGSKASFYAAVVAHHIRKLAGPLPEHDPEIPPEHRLASFIRWLMRKMTACGNEASMMELQRQEFARPSPLLDEIVEEMIRPEIVCLESIIRELVPTRTSDETVRRHVLSVMGQCTFYRHARPVLQRLYPDLEIDESETDRIAQHVASVTLQALRSPEALATIDQIGGP